MGRNTLQEFPQRAAGHIISSDFRSYINKGYIHCVCLGRQDMLVQSISLTHTASHGNPMYGVTQSSLWHYYYKLRCGAGVFSVGVHPPYGAPGVSNGTMHISGAGVRAQEQFERSVAPQLFFLI